MNTTMNVTLTRRIFLQRLGLGTAAVCIGGSAGTRAWANPVDTAAHLPRSLPEAQGVASGGILDFVNAVESSKLNLHSLMVVRHGQVVAEGWWAPYAADLRHTLY